MNDKEIAHEIHMLCSRIPGANFYTAAEMALEKAARRTADAQDPVGYTSEDNLKVMKKYNLGAIYRDAREGDIPLYAGFPRGPVPEDVMWALDRMCTPLHESRPSGAPAETDALCMRMIRSYILSVPRADEVAMEAKPVAHSAADIRRAALEEAYEAAMSCDGALNNAGAVAMKIRALIAATHASSVADAALTDERIIEIWRTTRSGVSWSAQVLSFTRAVLAANEEKK